MSTSQQIFRDSIFNTVIKLSGVVLSYFTTVYVASVFGATGITDAYYFVISIPTFFIICTSNAFKSAFIPAFTDYRIKNPDQSRSMASAQLFIWLALSLGLMGALAIANGLGAFTATTRFDAEANRVVRLLLWMVLPLVPLGTLNAFLSAYFHTHQRFFLPNILDALRNAILFAVVVGLSAVVGIQSMVLGHLTGFLVLTMVLFTCSSLGVRFWRANRSETRRIFALSLYPILGTLFVQSNPLIDRYVATLIDAGSVTILHLAEKVSFIPDMFFSYVFLGVALSHWSTLIAKDNVDQFRNEMWKAVSFTIFLLAPLVAFLLFEADRIVDLFYGYGRFGPGEVENTAHVLTYFLVGVVPLVLYRLLMRGFLVFQQMRQPFLVGILNASLNLFLNLLLAPIMGVAGIALSTSITSCVLLILTYVLVRKHTGPLPGKDFLTFGAKTTGPFICACLVFWGMTKVSIVHDLLTVIGSFAVGASVYIGLAWAVRSREALFLKSMTIDPIFARLRG